MRETTMGEMSDTLDKNSDETTPVIARANRFAVFSECPHCGGSLSPEHAHFKCTSCGWRDSCCD
jgi:transposase-like protein